MRLSNVFCGFKKDGQRKLLWKKQEVVVTSMGDIVKTIYYDLEDNVYIEPNEINVETLRPISSIVGYRKRMSRRKVVKKYKIDSNTLYNIKNVFYGNVVRKTTLYDLRTQNGYYIGVGRDDLYDDIFIKEDENVLFAQVDESKGKVESLKNGKSYLYHNKVNKGISVEPVRSIKKDCFKTDIVSKKKLLELEYKRKL